MKAANRITSLPTYIFAESGRRIAELQARGVDVINLGIGSPDLPPPRHIIDALYQAALKPDNHGYAGYYGIPALRQAIVAYYQRRFGVELDPDKEVVVLIGSKEGLANISQAFVDPGDLALIPDPGYPTYRLGMCLANGDVAYMPLVETNDFLPDFKMIPVEIARRARILFINYPNNPTGAVADLAFFERAVEFAREYKLLLCHDNPYCDVVFDGYVAPSILQVPGAKDVALEFNSLSKTYNMAGWRVGMAVGNPTAVEALARVKTNVDSGIFRPIQEAAVVALTGDQSWLPERNEIYKRRRDVVMDWLPHAGLKARVPAAGLYVWAQVPEGETSVGYCNRVLEQAGVWITPGTAFGPGGEGYVRIALTVPEERLMEAGERLKAT
ncbi:MAG: LL-diaminopimelate aminotransferase [Chloroflexi bacterium]|nr:LL-diaminopimelate aminotransferase [Chloroflexota bacterium]